MPDVHVDVGQRVTGVGVNDLDVHVEGHAGLTFDDVLADQLAGHIFMLLVCVNSTGVRAITYSKVLG